MKYSKTFVRVTTQQLTARLQRTVHALGPPSRGLAELHVSLPQNITDSNTITRVWTDTAYRAPFK